MSERERIDAQVDDLVTDPRNRDMARAMLAQSRQRGGISDAQIAHLLAIGYRSGYRSGYREGLADARPPAPPRRRRWWNR